MLGRVLEEDVVWNSITLLSLTLFTDYNELGIKTDTNKFVPVSATAFLTYYNCANFISRVRPGGSAGTYSKQTNIDSVQYWFIDAKL